MFLKWSKVALSLTLMVGPLPDRLRADVHRVVDRSVLRASLRAGAAQILMVSSFVFLPIRGVALPLLMGLGKPRTPAIASVAAGVLNLVLERAVDPPIWPRRRRRRNGDPERALRSLRARRCLPRARAHA